jgi:hypothetical protein
VQTLSRGNAALLTRARPSLHACQLYRDPSELVESVGVFAGSGLERGDAVVLIATPTHAEAFAKRLVRDGHDVERAQAAGQLTVLDANTLLGDVLREGAPDKNALQNRVEAVMQRPEVRDLGAVRLYGEMVSLLWQDGHAAAAIALDECWNELSRLHRFALFCAYEVDPLDGRTYDLPLHEIGRTHTDVLSTEDDERLRAAVDAASIDVLGISFSLVLSCSGREQTIGEHRLPIGQRTLLWLHRNMPVTSSHILERTRHYLRAS